jgi:sugar fermentation stimulation protein A
MTQPLTEVRSIFPEPLVAGRLLRRYQRFLADVELTDGRRVTVHCPNSGSMLGCLEPGAMVFCSPNHNPKRRTAYTWEMIAIDGQWVGINTMIPNELVARAVQLRALPLFRQALRVRREVAVAPHTRIDMMVEQPDGPLYVEVKNVTLVRGGEAHFPDAVTARGAKHLEQLMALVAAGNLAAMVYVVQRQDASSFAPATDIDPVYAKLYQQARRQGVVITAVEARVTPISIELVRELPLAL